MTSAVPASRRTGPSRSSETSDAIRDALVVELAARGIDRTSIDAVATRAGVGKAAIYRRWADKETMVLEVLGGYATATDLWADTGSLEGDLRAFFERCVEHLANPTVARIVSDLLARIVRDAAFAKALDDRVGSVRRGRGIAMIDRAVDRGELPAECDRDLAADLILAPLYWRLVVTRGDVGPDYVDQLVAVTVAAIHAGVVPGPGR